MICSEEINPFTPRVRHGDMQVVLAFESVDEILWCDHSKETSLTVLSHGPIKYFKYLSILQNEIWYLS